MERRQALNAVIDILLIIAASSLRSTEALKMRRTAVQAVLKLVRGMTREAAPARSSRTTITEGGHLARRQWDMRARNDGGPSG